MDSFLMKSPPENGTPNPCRSQVRALVRDLAGMFLQQMFFWGCDAQSGGNLLARLGGHRIAREHSCGEGSSRYQWQWQEGTVELHSFCAGWYPASAAEVGTVFIRGRERFFDCAGGQPLEPGHYDEGRFLYANAEEMLALLRPLLSWLDDYEGRVQAATSPGYRDRCFALYRQQGHSRPWLPPAEARVWLSSFLESPETTRRAKHLLRSTKAAVENPGGGFSARLAGRSR